MELLEFSLNEWITHTDSESIVFAEKFDIPDYFDFRAYYSFTDAERNSRDETPSPDFPSDDYLLS